MLQSVPKQNYGDVHVTKNEGYDGKISSLRYFDSALTGIQIQKLVNEGPDMSTDKEFKIFPPYFSLKWFLTGSKPQI